MSDQQSPPAKPKPGSLRDRIAAFEKPSTTPAAGSAAPVPRPKPGGLSWKPKQPSPPSSPSGASAVEHGSPSGGGRPGGMSASDAKESIGKGGSLKERMAALQGRGGFGAPPPIAPKPAMEKPKWKPPPVVSPPPPSSDDDEADVQLSQSESRSVKSPEGEAVRSDSGEEPSVMHAAEGEEGEEVDPVEEERQRRAAIAARMARLGGARVGMAPVFGTGRKVETPKEEPKPTDEEAEHVHITSPPAKGDSESQADYFPTQSTSPPVDVDAQASRSASIDEEATASRSPSSMPIPAVPRRTGPPRKKQQRSLPAEPEAEVVEPEKVEDDARTAALKEINALKEEIGTLTLDETKPAITADEPRASQDEATVVDSEEAEADATSARSHHEPSPLDDSQDHHTHEPEASKEEETTEEDEEARRKRVAEKLAKMGGVNPFAPQPQRASSSDDSPSSTLQKRASLKRDSVGSPPPPPPPQRKPSLRKASVDSTSARSPDASPRSSISAPPPPRKDSIGSLSGSPAVASSSSRTDVDVSVRDGEGSEIPKRRSSQDESRYDGKAQGSYGSRHGRTVSSGSKAEIGIPEEGAAVAGSADTNEDVGKAKIDPTDRRRHSRSKRYSYGEADVLDSEQEEVPPLVVPAPGPPKPNLSTRPSAVVPQVNAPVDPAMSGSTIPHPTRSLPQEPFLPPVEPARPSPPPPRIVSPFPEDDDQEDEMEGSQVDDADVSQEDEQEPLRRPPPHPISDVEEEDDDESNPPLPVPNRRSIPTPTQTSPRAYAQRSLTPDVLTVTTSTPVLPSSRPNRSIPPPPPPATPASETNSEAEEVLYSLHKRQPSEESNAPLFIPPPTPDRGAGTRSHVRRSLPPAPKTLMQSSYVYDREEAEPLTPTVTVSESEILDEEEGDPIDPSFHSPSRRNSTILQTSPTPPAPPAQEKEPEPVEEDETLSKRRTIAERMAKLGGLKFGAAPVPISASRAPPPAPRDEDESASSSADPLESSMEEAKSDVNEEDEERARKERIAAKLAGMGGMRIGMMPLSVGALRPQASHALKDEESPINPTPPPFQRGSSRAAPPQAQSKDADWERESQTASDDGVKVEAEESEIEEVSHEDARGAEVEEDAPPPVPTRVLRHTSGSVPSTSPSKAEPSRRTSYGPKPPVPAALPTRKSSVATTASTGRKSTDSSFGAQKRQSTKKPQSEYVMVEEPKGMDESDESAPPPLPSARPISKGPQARSATADLADSISSQWELPTIPSSSLEFGAGTDLTLSWSEDSNAGPPSPSSSVPPPPGKPEPAQPVTAPQQTRAAPKVTPDEMHLSGDELIAVWGRVGVQVCEAATSLFEKSKKSLVGDGTYGGFVHAVLSEVPNAAIYSPPASCGYLVYVQSGSSVQKRVSDIMPGDIVELHDAKLKGHKGIQTYSQLVGGAGDALVGVVSEFEPKKSKIRVFQANQHVGQQTVESVSYRLEDLKSGTVKVFRILEG